MRESAITVLDCKMRKKIKEKIRYCSNLDRKLNEELEEIPGNDRHEKFEFFAFLPLPARLTATR